MELKHLENGQIEADGKVYDLPPAITSVKGIQEDMLMLKLLGISYTDAFKAGCKQLIDTTDEDLEAMKAELDESLKAKDALTMKIKRLNAAIGEKESTEQEEIKESSEQFEHIVSEFERLAYPVAVESKKYPLTHLVSLHSSFTEDMVQSIYADATPEGKLSPETDKLREVLEKYIL